MGKKLPLLMAATFVASFLSGQTTATNFTCNDCAGNPHDLFSELNAQKVIVLSWVMPCGSCTAPTVNAYNVVQSFQSTHPGRVFMYIADDYANTTCASLNNWANSNELTNLTRFSNSAINMSNYGTSGMPKIVVLGGGYSHTVYFNQNDAASGDTAAIRAAINNALAAANGIYDSKNLSINVSVFPNPAKENSILSVTLNQNTIINVSLINLLGEEVKLIASGLYPAGETQIQMNTSGLSSGVYFVRVKSGNEIVTRKLIID
jgi:hypothetical protein